MASLEEEWDEYSSWRETGPVDVAWCAVLQAMCAGKPPGVAFEIAMDAYKRIPLNKPTLLAIIDAATLTRRPDMSDVEAIVMRELLLALGRARAVQRAGHPDREMVSVALRAAQDDVNRYADKLAADHQSGDPPDGSSHT